MAVCRLPSISCRIYTPPLGASHQQTEAVHSHSEPVAQEAANLHAYSAVARRDRHGARGGSGGGGARAPAVDGGAELGDGGGGVRAGGRGPGVPAALPARGVLLRRGGGGARGDHQGAQGPHVPLARRLLPRRRPRPPPRRRRRRRRRRAAAGGLAPALRQVQRLRRPHRGGPVRARARRVAPRRRRRPRPPALLRQGARPGALLLPAALRPGHKLQVWSDGAGVQLGAPHRRRGHGDDLLQPLGKDTGRQDAGRRHREPQEGAAGPRARRRRRPTLRQAGRAHRGLLVCPRRRRHGGLLLPRHRADAQEVAAAGASGYWGRLRAHLGAPVADGGEDQGLKGGEDGDGGEERHVGEDRQLPGQRAEGRVRGGGLAACQDRRVRAGGAAGQERRRRDGGGRGVPGGRGHLRREPDVRGHGAGGPVRAGDQGAEAHARGVRHGRRRRGGRRAGAAGRRRARPRRHGGAPQGRGGGAPRGAREHAPAAGYLKLQFRWHDLTFDSFRA